MSTTVLDRPPATDEVPKTAPGAGKTAPRMRLSEALRKGARSNPQGPGHVYNPYTHATCALGAAVVGLWGRAYLEERYVAGWRYFLRLIQEETGAPLDRPVAVPWVDDPLGGVSEPLCPLGTVIVHLNDVKGWSREEIADWVESLGY